MNPNFVLVSCGVGADKVVVNYFGNVDQSSRALVLSTWPVKSICMTVALIDQLV